MAEDTVHRYVDAADGRVDGALHGCKSAHLGLVRSFEGKLEGFIQIP